MMLQKEFRNQLLELSVKVKENRKEKIDAKKKNMRALVVSQGPYNMQQFEPPRPIPIKPNLKVHGIHPEGCTIFQSAMCPLKLDFFTLNRIEEDVMRKTISHAAPQVYSVIYKNGDDVRQD